jgi:transposase
MKSFGIDVDKKELKYFSREVKGKVNNLRDGRLKLIGIIKKLSIDLVVFENTGVYHRELARDLESHGIRFLIANPGRVRKVAMGLGKLAKTDEIDAEVLCWYGKKTDESPSVLPSKEMQELKDLNSRRSQIIESRISEKNRLSELPKSTHSAVRSSLNESLRSLKKQIKQIDSAMKELVMADEELKRKYERLMSITGVGDITAVVLIATLPELGTLSKRQISSLCGVAPFNNSSGGRVGKMSIYGGRRLVRSALYMAILSATRYNPPISDVYKRLLANGKLKRVAQVACMRKLIITLNAMLRDQSVWNPEGKPWPV